MNLYGMVGNNAINMVDILGFTPWTIALCLAKCGIETAIKFTFSKMFNQAYTTGDIKRYCENNGSLPPPSVIVRLDASAISIPAEAINCLKDCLNKIPGLDKVTSIDTEAKILSASKSFCNNTDKTVDYTVKVRVTLYARFIKMKKNIFRY